MGMFTSKEDWFCELEPVFSTRHATVTDFQMAVHLPSSESERHKFTIIQEPLASYSDTPALPGNLITYMKYSSSSGSCSNVLEGNTQQQHSNIDVLFEASNFNQSEQEVLPDLRGPRIGDHDLNKWKNGRNSMLLMTHVGDGASVLQGPKIFSVRDYP